MPRHYHSPIGTLPDHALDLKVEGNNKTNDLLKIATKERGILQSKLKISFVKNLASEMLEMMGERNHSLSN